MKDSSAVHTVPRIILRRVVSSAEGLGASGRSFIDLTISNPRDVPLSIRFTNVVDAADARESKNETPLHLRYPPISHHSPMHQLLRLNSPSPVIELGAYEDELLIEEEETEASSSVIGGDSQSENDVEDMNWDISIHHHNAHVRMPVERVHLSGDEGRVERSEADAVISSLCFCMILKDMPPDSSVPESSRSTVDDGEMFFYTQILM